MVSPLNRDRTERSRVKTLKNASSSSFSLFFRVGHMPSAASFYTTSHAVPTIVIIGEIAHNPATRGVVGSLPTTLSSSRDSAVQLADS